jgi:hypothetical protein
MSTKNRKPATTSDILPTNPSTLNPQPSDTPLPSTPDTRHSFSTTRARCGKVARLPKEIRDQINEMLLDGIPHFQIIQKLKQTFTPPAPQPNVLPLDPADASSNPAPSDSAHASRITNHAPDHATRNTQHDPTSSQPDPQISTQIENLTPHHLTTWKKFGGYRDWLKDQQRIADCKLRHELTLDLARSAEGLASYQAAPKVAVAQICQTVIDLGPEGLKDAMKDSPLNCFRLLNALARLINSGLKCEHQIQKTAIESHKQERGGITRNDLQQIERDLNLL